MPAMIRLEDDLDFDDLVYVLSHDLRAPARALGQYLVLLESVEGLELPERAAHYLKRMHQVVARMDGQLDELLALSRTATGAGRPGMGENPAVERVDIAAITAEIADELKTPVTIRGTIPPAAIAEDLARQLITELVKNVRDHAGPDADAQLSYSDGAYRLADHGPGVHERHHAELFLPFRPVAHPDSGNRGLGLAIVSRICRVTGSRVAIELPDDGGFCVVLTLPQVAE